MTRVLLFIAACSFSLAALAQYTRDTAGASASNYRPAVPPPTTNVYSGGYGGGYGGGASTAAGSALNGLSQVISASGQANLANSAAAINYTQAQSNEMRNEVQSVNTFWEMRDIGRAERAKERGPNKSPEWVAQMARAGLPKPLSPSELDPVSGTVNWPGPLTVPDYQDQRSVLDPLYVKLATLGALDYTEKTEVRENIDTMYSTLRGQIHELPPQDWVVSRTFLQRLIYAATGTTLQ